MDKEKDQREAEALVLALKLTEEQYESLELFAKEARVTPEEMAKIAIALGLVSIQLDMLKEAVEEVDKHFNS